MMEQNELETTVLDADFFVTKFPLSLKRINIVFKFY